jgi:hypothetical protein
MRCWSSRITGLWTRGRIIGKMEGEEEERHKGSLTKKSIHTHDTTKQFPNDFSLSDVSLNNFSPKSA